MPKNRNKVLGRPQINPENVPEGFRPLIPYVEKWGISDDGFLDGAIDQASPEELIDLVTAVSEFNVEGFDQWLGNPGTDTPTKEWVAFVSLINAYDLAKMRLKL